MPKTLARQKFDYKELEKEKSVQLKRYAQEIKGLIRNTLESAVKIGQILRDVKENILEYGQWQVWVDYEFVGNIKHDTAANFINLACLYEQYQEQHGDGLKKLTLWSLYTLSRKSVEPELQQGILALANDDIVLSQNEVKSVIKTYRKIKMSQAGLDEEVIDTLQDIDTYENKKELESLSKLSKTKQREVAQLIVQGEAQSTKQALKQILEAKRQEKEESTIDITAVTEERDESKHEVNLSIMEFNYKKLKEVEDNSVDVAFIEAPLRYTYVETELHDLCMELERVLCQGGYAVITVGHKAAMFCGDKIEPLKPAHLLCLRRAPGMSRSIIGLNITSASVFAIFCYKSPYRAPKGMLVDLQTYNENPLTDTEAIKGFDEIPPNLEKCIERFLSPLTETGSSVLHMIVSENHFSIRESMRDTVTQLGARKFITVG